MTETQELRQHIKALTHAIDEMQEALELNRKLQWKAAQRLQRLTLRHKTLPKTSLGWIVDCVTKDALEQHHLNALGVIAGLMPDCEDAETDILTFAHELYEKYAE